jgi:hypothetical protein
MTPRAMVDRRGSVSFECGTSRKEGMSSPSVSYAESVLSHLEKV